jgi:hypothetical protein
MARTDPDERDYIRLWLLYGMATVTESPGQEWAFVRYSLLGCALIGSVGC